MATTRTRGRINLAKSYTDLIAELRPAAEELIRALDDLETASYRATMGGDVLAVKALRGHTDTMTTALLRILREHGVVKDEAVRDLLENLAD